MKRAIREFVIIKLIFLTGYLSGNMVAAPPPYKPTTEYQIPYQTGATYEKRWKSP